MRKVLLSTLLTVTALVGLVAVMTPYAYSQSYVMTTTNQIYRNQFIVSGNVEVSIDCEVQDYYQALQFPHAFAGSQLFGNVTTNNPITLYVLNSSEFKLFLPRASPGNGSGSFCARFSPQDTHLTVKITNFSSMHWIVPASDTYYFVFVNRGSVDAAVSLTYWTQQLVTETP